MRNADCSHRFGLALGVGSGAFRRSCDSCGDVEIDLRTASVATDSFVERVTRFGSDWTGPTLNFATGG